MATLCPLCALEIANDDCIHHLVSFAASYPLIEFIKYNEDAKGNCVVSENDAIALRDDIIRWERGEKVATKELYFGAQELAMAIEPCNWGKLRSTRKGKEDLLHEYIMHLGTDSNILNTCVFEILDGFARANDVIKDRCTYISSNEQVYGRITEATNLHRLSNVCLTFKTHFWQPSPDEGVSKFNIYLELFFNLRNEISSFTKLAIEKILSDIQNSVQTQDDANDTAVISKHLINQLFISVGRRPIFKGLEAKHISIDFRPVLDRHDLTQLRSFRAFMQLLSMDKKLHERIKGIWKFLIYHNISSLHDTKEVIEIEKEYTQLRICIEELEEYIFSSSKNISPARKTKEKLRKLFEDGVIDRYLYDSLNYLYGLMCWKAHGRSTAEKERKEQENPLFLKYILWRAFETTLLFLLPKAVSMRSMENRSTEQ